MTTFDVIIPVYKPGPSFGSLLRRILVQDVLPGRVIIMNTEKEYWKTSYEDIFADSEVELSVHHLTREAFDHGATRQEGIGYSDAEVVVCMTHDAMPYDKHLFSNLLSALMADERIACAYARQLPAKDCREIERFTRKFNYPEESRVKSLEDLETLGIKTYFCSNVTAAYKRSLFEKLGGFTKKTIFNEDMVYAAGAIKAGYKVAYAAEAKVIHSHNYGAIEQIHRNFDLAVSQADHPEVFAGIKSEGEGIRLVENTAIHLLKRGKPLMIITLVIHSGCKYLGYLLGKRYKSLPKWMIKKLTMNPYYWEF